ncbi:4Fe-4S dicluster domain-containing protein [Vulgatibacter sp.]|uniref:4Fe-4S dicluster domain-containing protein n=1 Tax=Vulgatibacter sp. TaxID=1971226 RepID=UPI0035661653
MSEGHQLPLLGDERWSRRGVLHLLGLGALAACQPPRERILPYTVQPAEVVPGKPLFYASSMTIDGYATGLLVESHVGRPTKIEGNPEHPASLGATGLQHQASILELYDPARARYPRNRGGPAGWAEFVRLFGPLPPGAGVTGAGLHFVLEPTSSPLTISLIEAVRRRFPEARFHFHAPLHAVAADEASRRTFGRVLAPQPRFDRAARVLSVDGDFLGDGPFGVRWAHDFAARRRVRSAEAEMNRLYVVEPAVSITGAVADHRLRARPSEVPLVLAAVAAAVVEGAPAAPEALRRIVGALPAALPHRAWAEAVARDLLAHRGESLVIAGAAQPAAVHVLIHALNDLLGNVGATIDYTPPALYEAGEASHGLGPLLRAIDAEEVGTLVLLDVDPAYDCFAEDRFVERLRTVPQSVCVSLHETATAKEAGWFIPGLHWLEQWGDARAYDGTLSFRQPLIRPLFDGHGALEVLAVFGGAADPGPHRLLRALYREREGIAFEQALQRGFLPGTAFERVETTPREGAVAAAVDALAALAAQPAAPGLEVSLRPDPKLRDGRFAHNEWLLELPDPITRISWDNAALLAPATAERLGLGAGDVVELRVGEQQVTTPVFPHRGVAAETIAVALGWGGWQTRDGEPVGADFFAIRSRQSPWRREGASLERARRTTDTGEQEWARAELASGQPHIEMHGRPILLHGTLEAFRKKPDFVEPHDAPRPSIYGDPWPAAGQQWGMSIDLGTCTGCATCVIACQAENNVPTVGKVGVARGREMHWLRIDRYFLGTDEETVQLLPQPMLCQHCEKAPCEYVCPVNATVHSPDGLNEMIYNRCVGTRFCSNNCPYKVRRFNYFEYNDPPGETQKMQKNPEVTVRARGVMEKCTYCVQRIRTTQIEARIEGRQVREGEVRTACQAACPTGAIVFGLVSDPASEVSRLHADPRCYGVLQHELGTAPRTRYLAHLRNVNEEVPA